MATYYWVNGSGDWNDELHWDTVSGGPGGSPATATTFGLTNTIVGTGVGTEDTTPTVGSNDDGYWELSIPFNISYLGVSYSNVFVGSNGYITFGSGSSYYNTTYADNSIGLPKIYVSNTGDNSCQRIYYQTNGVAPTRTFWVRYEGSNSSSGTLGNPTQAWEAVFYEATPNRIDIHYDNIAASAAWIGAYSIGSFLSFWSATSNTSVSVYSSAPTGVVPTATDNAIFDSESSTGSYNVNISNSSITNWTASGPATGTLTFTGSGNISVYGDISWSSTGITRNYSGTIFLPATSGSYNLDFGGTTNLTVMNMTIGPNSASTATWTLGSAIAGVNSLSVRSGTFNTNNYNISCGGFFSSTTTYTRAISLGSSQITVTGSGGAISLHSTNLTFNAGTSTITSSASSFIQLTATGAFTFYNLRFFANDVKFTHASSSTININDLTFEKAPSIERNIFNIRGTVNVNGTLTWWPSSPSSVSHRREVYSTDLGTVRTINAAAFSEFKNIDFRDITAIGSASWSSGTSIGDAGGNTGITFDAPKTVYWSLPEGGYWKDVAWATISGGTSADANHPLPQDTAVIDNAGLSTDSIIDLSNIYMYGSIDMFDRTFNLRITNPLSIVSIHGDLKLPSGTLINESASTVYINFNGRGTQIYSSNGSSLPVGYSIDINKFGGSVEISSNVNHAEINRTPFTLVRGSLEVGNHVLRCRNFISSGSATRSIAVISPGKIEVFGSNSTVVNLVGSGLTAIGEVLFELSESASTGTRTIDTSNTGGAQNISYDISAGTDTVRLGTTYFSGKNLNFTGFSGVLTIPSVAAITGNLTLSSTMTTASSVGLTFNNTASETISIDTKNVLLNFPITISGNGAIFNLSSPLNLADALTISEGTFDTYDYNISAKAFTFNSSATKAIYLGFSTITLNPGTTSAVWTANATGTTFDANISTIIINQTTSTGLSFTGGSLTYSRLYILGSGTGSIVFGGSNTYSTFVSQKPVATTLIFAAGSTQTFEDTIKINGALGRKTVVQSPSTTPVTFVKTGGGTVDLDYLDISYINASTADTWYAGLHSTSVAGANTNWRFNEFSKTPKVGSSMGFFR